MQTLIFATGNENKAKEVQHILQNNWTIKSLKDLNFHGDIEEPFETLEENSLAKATFVHQNFNVDCFSEDSGLFVEALNGAPGVYSSRYAGAHANSEDNIHKLLAEMNGMENRNASFKTIITLLKNGEMHQFYGECKGTILHQKSGESGFGYDPIFIPNGATKSFAEMTMDEKNIYSHRRKAVEQFIEFLMKN